jgi:hypothetical protein
VLTTSMYLESTQVGEVEYDLRGRIVLELTITVETKSMFECQERYTRMLSDTEVRFLGER